jgi:ABC-type sugar transport system ATPase subunit
MTVLENVVAPLRGFRLSQLNAGGVSGAEAERAESLLEFVGMQRFAHQQAGALSYGQQKLVELAQILMLDPKLIMLDEPTAALGVAQTAEVLNLIERVRDRGHAVIMISHNMEDVRAVADRIVVLRLGRNNGIFAPDASNQELVAAITGADDNAVSRRANRNAPETPHSVEAR